jgi:hypothetical protein
MTDKQSQNQNDTTTAPEHSPASVETPPAAETASPASSEAEAASAADTGDDGKSPRALPRVRSRSRKRAQRTAGVSSQRHADASTRGVHGVAERLLALLTLPHVALDRRLLPAPLLGALDAAGLGTADQLPSVLFATLAAIGAVTGLAVHCEPVDGMPGTLSLRVALLTVERRLPLVPAPVLAAAYAAENDALDAYNAAVQRDVAQRRLASDRRRLHEQATRAAAALGIVPPPPLPDAVQAQPGPRPRIVVADGAGAAVRLAAAGGTGILVVDERHMASLANVAGHYDTATDAILNTAAAGHPIPVADPISHRVMMRRFSASVIGALTSAECGSLHEANAAQLTGTVFVPAAPTSAAGDSTALITLMRRVQIIGGDGTALHLPVQDNALATAAAAWAALAGEALPPLSDYLAGLPNLVHRLAALLHLAAAAGGDGQPAPEISPATVKRAAAIANAVVLPVAQAVLGPVSTPEVERDARRVIAHLRETTSAAHRQFERRPLLRAWQNSMSTTRLDAALALLQEAELLVPLDNIDGGKGGGQRFEVAPAILEAV